MEALVTTSTVSPQCTIENAVCGLGYDNLVNSLKLAGCNFTPGDYMRMWDSNICLSMMDAAHVAGDGATCTSTLNVYSNCVARTMIFGGSREREAMAQILEEELKSFIPTWAANDADSQEVRYVRALEMFLRKGVMAAEAAVKPKDYGGVGQHVGVSSLDGYADELVGVRSSSRSPGADDVDQGLDLRLYDTYQSAFQRVVVDVCLHETLPGMQTSVDIVGDKEDYLSNFVSWERSLRTDLTDKVRNTRPNPNANLNANA